MTAAKKPKPQIKIIWHEPSNFVATFQIKESGLPLLAICDDEYTGINPFYAYPWYFLKKLGWIELGEL